jgi:hypothetical protein
MRLGTAAKAFGIGFGLVAAGALVSYAKAAFKAVDATAKLARELEISTSTLMGYQLAAGLSGVETATLNKSIEKMAKIVGEARLGVSTGTLAMRDFGMEISKLKGLSTQQIFETFADEIAAIPDPMERAAKASLIFGRSGIKLLNFLSLGSRGLARVNQEVKALGLSFDEIEAKKIEDANDALLKMSTVLEGLGTAMALDLAPHVTELAEDMATFVKESGGIKRIFDEALGAVKMFAAQVSPAFKLMSVFGEGRRDEFAQFHLGLEKRKKASLEHERDVSKTIQEIRDARDVVHHNNALAANAAFIKELEADLIAHEKRKGELEIKALKDKEAGLERANMAAKALAQKERDRLDAIQDVRDRVQGIFEETRTPLENVKADIKEIFKLMDKGFGHDLHMGLVRRLQALRKEQESILNPKGKDKKKDKTDRSRSPTFKQIDLKNIMLGGEGSGKNVEDKQLEEQKKSNGFLMALAKQGMPGRGTVRMVAQ